MWRERYAADIPLSFLYRQIPPTSEPFSKQENSTPRSSRFWQAVIPEDPAPITQTRGLSLRSSVEDWNICPGF